MKFDICVFFENLFRKSKFRSNLQERVLYMKAYVHLWYLAELFLEGEMFKTKVVEKTKTHFILNNFSPERRGVYDTMKKKKKKALRPDTPQMTIHYGAEKMRFPCPITTARTWALTHNY
jgi:hypothetical protein